MRGDQSQLQYKIICLHYTATRNRPLDITIPVLYIRDKKL